MESRLKNLEKNVESSRKLMEERVARVNKNLEFMWKKMEEQDERLNQQMQALRGMLISYMASQKTDRDGAQFELSKLGDSGVKTNHQEDRSVQEDETGELEEEKKQTIRRKVELPNFDGSDPNGWMARAEIIFKIHDVKPEQRVDMAFVSMGGPAVHWFQCLLLQWSNLSWKKFRTELMKRFCGRQSGNI